MSRNQSERSLTYQPHIDGLRAIAVLSVVVFHLSPGSLPGGFLGVDIFFVISGYLITSLIMKEIVSSGGFDFLNFYRRRIRRLFPALIATITFCLLLGAFVYTPQRLMDVAVESIFAILSTSNIYFWQVSGYFETVSEQRTLLHTWSLSVEEQFYLLWPLSIFVAYRILGLRGPWLLLLVMFALSLFANILFTIKELNSFDDQFSAMFYLMPFRVYELAIGAFGYWVSKRHSFQGWPIEFIAITAMLILAFYLSVGFEAVAFPSYHGLIPCFAVLLLILARSSNFLSLSIGNRIMVWVGLISYSLYLVHWPVIVFYKYLAISDPSTIASVFLLLLMLVLAACSYYFVEKPFRQEPETKLAHSAFFGRVLFIVLALLLVSYSLVATLGLEFLHTPSISIQAISDAKARRDDKAVMPCKSLVQQNVGCSRERAKPIQILVIGDSHELDGFNSMNAISESRDDTNVVRFGNMRLCDVQIDQHKQMRSETKKSNCQQRIAALNSSEIIEALDVLVLSANQPFTEEKHYIWRVVSAISTRNPAVKVVVIGGFLNTRVDCAELVNRTGEQAACKHDDYLEYIAKNDASEISAYKRKFSLEFLYVDKFMLLCSDGLLDNCKTSLDGMPAFYDRHHLSLEFSEYFGTLLWREYEGKILK